MLTLFIDPNAVPNEKRKDAITKACSEIKATVDFVPQIVEKTISWHPPASAKATDFPEVHKEILAVLEAEDAVTMMNAYIQRRKGDFSECLTLTEWVDSVLSALPGKNLTIIVVGLSKFFSKQKLSNQHRYRELVTGQPATKAKKKTAAPSVSITQDEVEEACVDVQLMTGCILQHVDTDEQLATQVKMITKAVAEKADKKDRLDSVFSFLEEGAPGVSVNRQGEGLAKVWRRQLMQFKNFGPEMAEAVQNVFPSPMALHQACKSCSSPRESEQLIGDINVRRNASIISTNRKIGKEHARRIHTFMTSTDPEQIVK